MVNELINKIEIYKEHIYSFEESGMILLDRKNPSANSIINQIYSDANEILKIYNKNETELTSFIKDALKQLAFDYNQGVVLIQEDKILIRGKIEKDNITDLMKLVFIDNKSLNKFLHSSISLYLSLIDIRFLSLKEVFNISNIYKRLMIDFIKLLENDFDIGEKLKDSSIKIENNNGSYKKVNLIIEKILKDSFGKKSGMILGFMSDFLLRISTTNNIFDIKIIKYFFEKEILENDKTFNFTTIRQNSIAREKYLKLIDIAEIKIEESKTKVYEFLKVKNIENTKTNELKDSLLKSQNELKDVEETHKNLLEKRQKIKNKDSQEYLDLSDEIKVINTKKTELDVEIKNLNSKYEFSKQELLNIEQDRVDYLKLLPELIETQESKIKEICKNLKEFDEEYLNIKRFLIKVLMKKKPNFDFEKLLQEVKKIKIKKEFCTNIKDKLNPRERRFNGLPIDELENLKNQIFESEDNINKFIIIITNQALKKELNFKKISNIEFMNKNIVTIQKYIFLFLNKIIKNSQNTLIEGFGNFILRDKFNLVLTIQAEKFLNILISDNLNAKNFIDYFNGEIDEDITGKYKRPELIDKNGNKVSTSKINSIITQYRDYINFLTKKNELINTLNTKLIKLNSCLQQKHLNENDKLELITKQCEITKHDLEIVKKEKDNFLLNKENLKDEFEKLIDIIANVLYKKREKID